MSNTHNQTNTHTYAYVFILLSMYAHYCLVLISNVMLALLRKVRRQVVSGYTAASFSHARLVMMMMLVIKTMRMKLKDDGA